MKKIFPRHLKCLSVFLTLALLISSVSAIPFSAAASAASVSPQGYKLNYVSSGDMRNEFWSSNDISVTDVDGGGVNINFNGDNGGMCRSGYRILLAQQMNMDDLYLEFGHYNSKGGWPAGMAVSFGGELWLRLDTNNRTGSRRVVYALGNSNDYEGVLYENVEKLWVESMPNYLFSFHLHFDGDGSLQVDFTIDGTEYTGAKIPADVIESIRAKEVVTSSANFRIGSGNASAGSCTYTYSVDFYGWYNGKEKVPTAESFAAAVNAVGAVDENSDRAVRAARSVYEKLPDSEKTKETAVNALKVLEAKEAALAAAIEKADKKLIPLTKKTTSLYPEKIGFWDGLMSVTDIDRGVNISFVNDSGAGDIYSVRTGPSPRFDLEGLTLRFDNLKIKNPSQPIAFALATATPQDVTNEGFVGDYNSENLILEINTQTGTLSLPYYSQASFQNDALKSENLAAGRFDLRFGNVTKDDALAFTVTVVTSGNEVSFDIPIEATDSTGDFDPYCAYNSVIKLCARTTYSVDLIGYSYSGKNGGIDNSSLLPEYVSVSGFTAEEALNTPDWADDLIIAELNPIKAGCTFAQMYPILDHLAEAGINGLWLSPVYDPGYNSDGTRNETAYSNLGIHTINPVLTGTDDYAEGWQELADFIKEAHSRNIRVFLDVISWGVKDKTEFTGDRADYLGSYNTIWNGYNYNWENEEFVNWYVDQLVTNARITDCDGYRYDLEPNETYAGYAVGKRVKEAVAATGRQLFYMSENKNTRKSDAADTYNTYDTEQISIGYDPGYINSRDMMRLLECNPFINDISFSKYTDGSAFTADRYSLIKAVKEGANVNGGAAYKYYTMMLSSHDSEGMTVKKNELAIGYQAIFSPFIPIWYFGEEFGLELPAIVYDQSYSNWKTVSMSDENYAFYETVKQMIKIRRSYRQIFSNFSDSLKDSNFCEVKTAGGNIEAYARYAGNTAILVVPNNEGNAKTITASVELSNLGLAGFGSFIVTDAMTGEVIKENASAEELTSLQLEVEANSQRVIALEAVKVQYDVNTDGSFDSLDMAALKLYLLGVTPEGFDAEAAHINDDGVIDIRDLICIKKLLAK